ncbi:MAG: YncE family protein [Geobacteraceae bacterium]|nr:YncE family protein [Geobacteraceae bacterium]
MKFKSLMTAICVLATANIVSAAPFAYVANSGTKNVSVIDTATNTVTATVALPDTQPTIHPYAYSVTVGASGQYVYVGLQDTNEVTVIDAATNAVVKRIGLGTDSPGGLAVNAAETRLYVTSNKSNTLIIINITGSGASEITRVAVETAAQSNPEGVVLSPDGKKAYVANSTTGSIAEISLDEANNVYTRTNLISLVNNTSPYGLAINSTGTKLYAASYNGTASVINTSTRAVTDLPVAAGYSVSVSADNSKVYFPAVGLDKIYVADGTADTVSATTYSVPGAPWGSAIAPNGKLYLAMYSGPDSVKVFDPTSNTVTSTIALPAGAKPISMGDFTGPAFNNTITATSVTNCTITPSGAIPVNSYGRTFSMTTTGTGVCNWVADATNTGNSGSSYAFATPVNADHAITAQFTAGTPYILTASWIATQGGWIVSNPAGINATSQSATFASGTSVILGVNDGSAYQVQAGSWTGDCTGSLSTCTVVMNANKTFGVTIIPKVIGGGPIYNATKSTYHQTLAEATGAATTGDTIKISTAYTTGGSTTGTTGVTVTLSGGWDQTFTTQTIPSPTSMGAVTITGVAVIATNLKI